MKRPIVATLAALGLAGAAQAAVLTYTDQASFTAAAGPLVMIETFEDAPLPARDVALPSYSGPGGEITFTPISSIPLAPNVVVASPGYNNFGAGLNPTSSTVLTASGNEHFAGQLAAPTSALGFNVLLNDSPFTVTFFSGVVPLASWIFDAPPVAGNNLGFLGITSDIPVTGFEVLAINGEQINTGVDNVMIAAAVPEPATWLTMLLGFGALGGALRRRRSLAAATA